MAKECKYTKEEFLKELADFPDSTYPERAQRLGMNIRTIYKYLKRFKLVPVKKTLSEEVLKKDLADFPDSKFSERAKRLNVTYSCVYFFTRKFSDYKHKKIERKKARVFLNINDVRKDFAEFPTSKVPERAKRLNISPPVLYALLNKHHKEFGYISQHVKVAKEKFIENFKNYPNIPLTKRAKLLGIHFNTLLNKMALYKIDKNKT